MIKELAVISIVLLLTSCASLEPITTVSFEINSETYGATNRIAFKNNWTICNDGGDLYYPFKIFSSTQIAACTINTDTEDTMPKQFVIKYAPWYTREQILSKGIQYPEGKYRDYSLAKNDDERKRFHQEEKDEDILWEKTFNQELTAIANLPPSSWQQITLRPADLIQKYKNQVPQYPAEANKKYSEGRKLNYLIKINPDGTYRVEDRLEWLYPSSKKPVSNRLSILAFLVIFLSGGGKWN